MDFNAQKRLLMDALLPLCPFVAVDATQPGVVVPESLKRADLVLRVGRDARVMGMPDLVLDETGWSATISLQGMRHNVSVPWEACLRLWIGEPFAGPMVVWPELAQKPKPPAAPRGPSLRVVKGGGGSN
jgi:stringent starvation protein B